MTANPTPTLHAGEKVDQFEIVEQVGSGGMSIVWKGYDRLLDRFVALKQLLPGSDAEGMRERFRAEADLHKRVSQDHRHIVRVLDFLDHPRGLFILMEFIEGPSLEQILIAQRTALDERRALGVVGATAIALGSIHDQGILHRDLKPSNILLPRLGGLKVTDFGVATLVAEQDVLTLGSARYMAPELFGGGAADRRADIYSLGLIAYEMLAGRTRFDEAFKIVLRDQRNQSLRWMKWHTNPRTQAPALSELNPKVSPTLSDLVARMMEKDPLRRIASAPELLEAIRRHFTPDQEAASIHALVPSESSTSAIPLGHGVSSNPSGPGEGAGLVRVAASAPPVGSADPTAPLPPRRRRVRILLYALIAEIALVIGAAYLYRHISQDRALSQRHQQALARLDQAMKEYTAGSFETAEGDFQKVAGDWPDQHDVAAKAKAMNLLSQAAMDVDRGSFGRALDEVNQADAMGAFRDNREQFQAIKERALNGASFAQVLATIKEQIGRGALQDAMTSVGKTADLSLSAQEADQIDKLKVMITGQQQQLRTNAEITRIIEDAKRMVLANHRDQAIALLNNSFNQYHSQPLHEYAQELTLKINVERALADGQAAEKTQDFKSAIDAYKRADALQPDKDLEAHIQELRSLDALAEGRRLLEQGDKAGAAAAFERSIQSKDNPDARNALQKVKIEQEMAGNIRAGDDAVKAKDYAAAVEHYQHALESGADAAVAAQLKAARVQAEIKKGDDALAQNHLDDALAALKRGQGVSVDDKDVKKDLDEFEHRVHYRQHLDAGDDLRRKSRFGEAETEYHKAREQLATKEINGRIDDTEYDHLIAQARTSMDNQQWASAQAQALGAQRIHATDQVKQLLDDISTHLEGASDGKAP